MSNSVHTKFWNCLSNTHLLFRDTEAFTKGETQLYAFFIDCPGSIWHPWYGKPSRVENICGAPVSSNFKIKKVWLYFCCYIEQQLSQVNV